MQTSERKGEGEEVGMENPAKGKSHDSTCAANASLCSSIVESILL